MCLRGEYRGIILALWMLSLEDCEIEVKLAYDEVQASLGYVIRYWLIYRKYI